MGSVTSVTTKQTSTPLVTDALTMQLNVVKAITESSAVSLGFWRKPSDTNMQTWLHFYQTRSAWSVDQGSTRKRSAVHNFVPTVTKFCVMWEGQALPHDTKFGNCRSEIIDRRVIISWSLIHGSSWSGLIKVGPRRLYQGQFRAKDWINNCTSKIYDFLPSGCSSDQGPTLLTLKGF